MENGEWRIDLSKRLRLRLRLRLKRLEMYVWLFVCRFAEEVEIFYWQYR